jgi:hypothetical protein
MDDRQQDQAFKERVKHVAFAEGADAAFDMLVQDGWTVPTEDDGRCPAGFWIFALASWQRRVLMRDSDGSFWAMQTKT